MNPTAIRVVTPLPIVARMFILLDASAPLAPGVHLGRAVRWGPYEARAERLLGFGAEPENDSDKTHYRRGGRSLDAQPRATLNHATKSDAGRLPRRRRADFGTAAIELRRCALTRVH